MTGDDIKGRPWSKLPRESGKAYAAFAAYLEGGKRRSIAKTVARLGLPSGATRHWEAWSSKFRWVERVQAYDASILEDKIAGRKVVQEEGRQIALDAVPDMMEELRDLSRGIVAEGQNKVKTNRDGLPVMTMIEGPDGEPVEVAVTVEAVDPKTRAKILTDLLAMAGVMAPVRQEITGADGQPLGLRASARTFDPELLAGMIGLLGLDL